ncbi:MAG: TlpA family protein disulfide reductase, partial [Verrucomicrobia bacterium]|nr:TlpA family protein disulfide reductase [Verrucomicrobiota bacterium]
LAADPADKLLGTRPPEWQLTNWLNSTPLKLADLRGKVVLVRWWTAPQCPYCRATAPALNEFRESFGAKGLVIVGAYHHKAPTKLDPKKVAQQAADFGFKFPVAIDPDWRTLQRWWLDGNEHGWTSVTFLLDRRGVIRHIHPGGQYVKGDEAYTAMKAKIEELLREPLPEK